MLQIHKINMNQGLLINNVIQTEMISLGKVISQCPCAQRRYSLRMSLVWHRSRFVAAQDRHYKYLYLDHLQTIRFLQLAWWDFFGLWEETGAHRRRENIQSKSCRWMPGRQGCPLDGYKFPQTPLQSHAHSSV